MTALASWMLVGAAGCQGPQRGGTEMTRPQSSHGRRNVDSGSMHRPGLVRTRFVNLGQSVQGRPLSCQVIGNGPDVVFILATIHGDEWAGTPLVSRLAEFLTERPGAVAGRTVVLMPLVNPDGYAARTRYNAHGIDLNRNFPADNFEATGDHGSQPLSEPESRAIMQVLEQYTPSRMVSIHQPLTCIDYDGPGEALAQAMGRWTDIPVKRLGSRPGSLGSYAGLFMGIPIITLEFPEHAEQHSPDELWDMYGRTLMAAVVFPEVPR